MKRLAIVTTHPIQYNAPLFKLLAERKNIDIKVFYTWGESVLEKKYDPGFGKVIEWDIPLLDGYEYEFLVNTAKVKGSSHFKGIVNPNAVSVIERYSPDAILIYGWAFNSHLKLLRHFKNKIPVLFRGDSTLLDKTNLFQSLKRKIFLRYIYSFIDFALYTGKNNYRYYKKAGLNDKQLVFAPHAIDNTRFESENPSYKNEAKLIREEMGMMPTSMVFLFAGKLEPKKDVEILLNAFMKYASKTSLHLLIVGNGILENSLKKRYQAFNVHFLDFQNQKKMPAIYEVADIYVLPSKGPGETWGLSVNEAMANGKAIIVSDKCGCAADLIRPGENGFIFKSGDERELSKILETLICDRALVKQMQDCSKMIIQDYTLNHVAEAIEYIINKKILN